MVEDRALNAEECLRQCQKIFPKIRQEFALDEKKLKWAKQRSVPKRYLAPVLQGVTEHGIRTLIREHSLTLGQSGSKDVLLALPFVMVDFIPIPTYNFDADRMINFYRKRCEKLSAEIKKFENVIREKESKADAGDVEAMLFLAKAYKASKYYRQAKKAWSGKMLERYSDWLDKAVQESGLARIGRLGREYIAGNFAEAAKHSGDYKLKRELKWLTEAMEAGDGWAAFTKGNICYYGYGRRGERKKEAYDCYCKAFQSKDAVYALEMEKCVQ